MTSSARSLRGLLLRPGQQQLDAGTKRFIAAAAEPECAGCFHGYESVQKRSEDSRSDECGTGSPSQFTSLFSAVRALTPCRLRRFVVRVQGKIRHRRGDSLANRRKRSHCPQATDRPVRGRREENSLRSSAAVCSTARSRSLVAKSESDGPWTPTRSATAAS